ncbi:MAG: right-handed parallel beta-helix repeat-containing protein [Clostridia bacterium]|nr:right-handed parallel beta-helix repeat-containing protein [Clostridia bacterium]
MTSKSKTKRAFISSLIVLALCFTLFAGTTFAWFTDTVVSRENIIAAGNLKADLLIDAEGDGNYASIADWDGGIFDVAETAQNSTFTLWEPGKTQIAYLAVSNIGNLALKYNIILDVLDRGLAGALEYAIIDGATAAQTASLTSWDDLLSVATATGQVRSGRITAAPYGKLAADETDYFVFAVHMRTDAGNEYQEKDIIFDVNLVATQATAESDSFNDQYDAGAEMPEPGRMLFALSHDELIAALNDVNAADDEATPVINAVGSDLGTLHGYHFKKDVIIRNAVFSGTNGLRYCYADNGTKVTFVNCTFNGATYGAHFDGGNGALAFENCDIKGWNSFGRTITSVVFTNCSFSCSPEYGSIRFYQDGLIESCYFSDDYKFIDCNNSGSVIRINDSNVTTGLLFNNGSTVSQWFIDGTDVSAQVGTH